MCGTNKIGFKTLKKKKAKKTTTKQIKKGVT